MIKGLGLGFAPRPSGGELVTGVGGTPSTVQSTTLAPMFRVQDSRFRVSNLGFRICGFGFGLRIEGMR